MNSSQNIFSLVLGEVASQDSNHLSQKSALIVGAGSLGVAVSDILVKLKIGKLILFDYDREEIAREEVTRKRRSFFSTNQHESCLRMMSSRLTALVTKLKLFDPNVKLERHNFDITAFYNLKTFVDRIKYGSLSDGKVDLVLVCTNDFGSHMAANTACSEENQPWISCVCSTPMSGQVRLHEFGKDASRDLNTISELFTCPDKAILPSTINIVSGVMTQIALKFLLKFGSIQRVFNYNGLNDIIDIVSQQTPPIVITVDQTQEIAPQVISTHKRQLRITNTDSANNPRPKKVKFANTKNVPKCPHPISFHYKLRSVHIATLCDIEKIKNIKNSKINVTATIMQHNDDNIMYAACTKNKCKIGLTILDSDKFHCRKCGPVSKSRPAYRVRLSIADFSGFAEIVLFDTAATMLFGQSADNMYKLMRKNDQAYKKAINACLLQTYDFEIRYHIKKEVNMNMTLVADACSPVEPKRYCRNLTNAINKLNVF